uniref:Protein kinase domain-containing protein n=1 Tax=Fagus sylvatica TaxID=28930 RepID=A0A2N9HBV7_FAGSY
MATLKYHMRELTLKTKPSNSRAARSRKCWRVEPRISDPCSCGTRPPETSQISLPIFPLSLIRGMRLYIIYGDGLAFFHAPDYSKMPLIVNGSALGLATDDQVLNSTDNPFVAVEFDIFNNTWDPTTEHVGIDINSMKSVATVSWLSNIAIREGKRNEAWISYNSSSHNLSVIFTGFSNNIVMQSLSENVDLSHLLPEWVTFGFSATTGNACAIHTIYSWDFSSLEIDASNPINPALHQSPVQPLSRGKTTMLGLVVGFTAGGLVLGGGLALGLFELWKKNKRDIRDDQATHNHVAEEFPRGREPIEFSYNDLAYATNNFNNEQRLGQRGCGAVFKGFLRDTSSDVAVKRIFERSGEGLRQYADIKSSNIMLDLDFTAKLGDFGLARLVDHTRGSRTTDLAGTLGYMDPECFQTGRTSRASDVYSFGIVVLEIACGRTPIDNSAPPNQEIMLPWVRELYRRGRVLEAADRRLVLRFSLSFFLSLIFCFSTAVQQYRGTELLKAWPQPCFTCMKNGNNVWCIGISNRVINIMLDSDFYAKLGDFGLARLVDHAKGSQTTHLAGTLGYIDPECVTTGKASKESDVYSFGIVALEIACRRKPMECLIIVGLLCVHSDRSLRHSIRQAIHLLNFEAPLPLLPIITSGPSYLARSSNE